MRLYTVFVFLSGAALVVLMDSIRFRNADITSMMLFTFVLSVFLAFYWHPDQEGKR